eukprot:14263752-Ditylum_brightwellii.AAC.1
MAVVDEVNAKGRILNPQDSDDVSCALGNDGGSMTSDYTNVSLALSWLKKTVDRLIRNSNDDNNNEGGSNPLTDGILSHGGTTATYHQENVLPTGDF